MVRPRFYFVMLHHLWPNSEHEEASSCVTCPHRHDKLNPAVKRSTIPLLVILITCSLATSLGQWREVSLPRPYDLGYYLDVFFLPADPNLGWACSIEGYVVRTTDAGRTWQGTQIPRGNLEYIQFLNARVGYSSGSSGLYRSTDGGRSWRVITPALVTAEKMWGSYWLNENEGVFFVGGCATGNQYFYRTEDAGSSWTVFVTSEPNSGLSDGILFQNGNGYAVSSGVLWGTSDAGQSWFKITNTGAATWNEEIAVFGRSILVPSSGTDCDGQTRGVGALRFSRDAGRSWSEFQTRANMFGTFLVNDSTGWGVGDERAVFQTTNYGRSWVRRDCGIRGNIDDVWFVNDTLGWAVGQGIYRTSFNSGMSRITIFPDVQTTSICAGDSLFVEAKGPFAPYEWSDGIVAPSRFIDRPGTYTVKAFDSVSCVFVKDTITVTLRSTFVPKISSSEKAVCEGDSMTLSVIGPVISWLWSTGDTTSSIVTGTAGRVTCATIDTGGCRREAAFDVIVNPNPRPVIVPNRGTTICLDEEINLAVDKGFVSYRWSTGETTRSITTSIAGDYIVEVVDEKGCVGRSAPITVVVKAARNKAEFQFMTTPGEYVIDQHDVGQVRCMEIDVRNTSDSSSLIMRGARFVGNVFFSVPPAQFPIIAGPSGRARLMICASAIELGRITDTLLYDDTCSTTRIPVSTTGTAIDLSGISRCDLPVETSIIRAGSAWRLRAPYPNPSDEVTAFYLARTGSGSRNVELSILDMTGTPVMEPTTISVSKETTHVLNVSALRTGLYLVLVMAEGEPLSSFPLIISR